MKISKNRLKTDKEIKVLCKKKENFLIRNFEIRELDDESGEVKNNTFIQLSFEGILINLTVATAMELGRNLSEYFSK